VTPLLSLVTFLPGAAGLALLFIPRRSVGVLRSISLAVTVLTFACSLPLYFGFDGDAVGYQFEENRRWMPTLGVAYHVGIDGISLLLVLLTTFLTPLALVSAWGSIEDRFKEFTATMLLLETGMLGVFVSLDPSSSTSSGRRC
jgi:NADH-quinone oxidoreductase subunit M